MACIRNRERAHTMVSAIELQVCDLVIVVRVWYGAQIPICATRALGEVIPARVRLVLDDQIEPGSGLGGIVGVRRYQPDIPK